MNPSFSFNLLTDEIEEDKPILEFDKYCDTIIKIVSDSKPRFSLGIYGQWGTGKTTLMKLVQKKFQEGENRNNILTVWFNAWRYEREEQFALLMTEQKCSICGSDLQRLDAQFW